MRSVLYKLIIAACLVAGLVSITGCSKDTCTSTYTYTMLTPVFKDLVELRAAVKSEAPRNIEQAGKIYLYGNYIFLNELNKGIHIIDNSNPAAPSKFAFINIPGNVDMAVKGNILYADSYFDLVALDISDPHHVTESKRLEFVFPERQYEYGLGIATAGRVIVDFIAKDTTISYACNMPKRELTYDAGINAAFVPQNNFSGGNKSLTSVALGKGGSLARFALMNNYLYTVGNSQLQAFDVSNPSQPAKQNDVHIGWGIETIFPYKDNLFIGSQTGMFIFDASDPAHPAPKGAFTHVRTCDPVVVENDIAYVTLRGGTTCGGLTNQLDVLNIKNLSAPALIKSYPMTSPYGLGIDAGKLFICEGPAGLKFLNAERADNITTVKVVEGIEAFDVIPQNNLLLVTAKDGLYQYDYSVLGTPRLVSRLPITVTQ
jgi:hypothetical protein